MYVNGEKVLPPELIKEIQKYIQGEAVYIPKADSRIGWGQKSGTKQSLQVRNDEILSKFSEGQSIGHLMDDYHLSYDSVRKIVYRKSERMIPTNTRDVAEPVR